MGHIDRSEGVATLARCFGIALRAAPTRSGRSAAIRSVNIYHPWYYAAACGFPPLPSATAYGVLSAFNMLGMVAAGWLTDRVHRPLLLGSIYILRGLSFILLMYIASDISLLFLFAVVFGLFDYSTVPVTASLVASHIGLKVMGLTMGLLAAGHALGAAAGAFLGGWLFDLFAKYDWVWAASIGLSILAGVLVFAIREDRGPAAVPAAAPATA